MVDQTNVSSYRTIRRRLMPGDATADEVIQ
jgi:hypothetical protein